MCKITNLIEIQLTHFFNGLFLKVPMKWNFCFLFYSIILKSMILWFVIFEFGLRTSAYEFFLEFQSSPIRVNLQFVRIHRPNCKATNATVLSRHFEQSLYRRLLNSGGPLQWRCRSRFVILAPARENFDFAVLIPKIIMKSLEFSYIYRLYHSQATLVCSASGEFVFHSVFPII